MPESLIVQSLPLPAANPPLDKPSPFAGDMHALVDAQADRYGVPRDLAHTVVRMESAYNPNADSGKAQGNLTARSLAGKDVPPGLPQP